MAITRNPRVRPYVLTGGRTRVRVPLLVETRVSVPDYDPRISATLLPESQAVYEYASRGMSVAELSACAGIPLGVTRVLLSDLAARDEVLIHPTGYVYQHNLQFLERIRDGLRALSV
ncbi:MAG TPA: DUF742 domain-containing protein [Micromonosporaceae bacterium]